MAVQYGCHVLGLFSFFIFIQVVRGMTIVDDRDPLMAFSNVGPSWWGADWYNGGGRLVGGVSIYDRSKNPYKWTWHEVLGDGAFVSVTFTGTRVNLNGTICRTGYPTTVDFYIDDKYMTRFQHIPEDRTLLRGINYDIYLSYTMADFDNLSPAQHTLKAISVGAETLFVVDFIAYEHSAISPVSSSPVSSISVFPSSGIPSTIGSTSIRPTSNTFSTVSTSLSASSSSQSISSTGVGDFQPLVAAMDTPAFDSRIVYSPPEAWSPYNSIRRATSCLGGIRSSSTAASYLTYNFTGTAIHVYTVSNSIGGNYSISIDGENQGIFTSYAASEDPSNCSSGSAYSTTELEDTQHTLILTLQDHPAGSTQNTIQFVGFRVSSSPVGAPSSSRSVSGPNVGAIVGVVVGILASFFLLILSILWWMRRQRQAEEASLTGAPEDSASFSIHNDPLASAPRSEGHTQGQAASAAESVSLPGPPLTVQFTPSVLGVPNARNNIPDDSSERITYYTLPSYHENAMQQATARNLSEADFEAISRRLRQVMRNQAIQSSESPSEPGNMMPPRELIDHLIQELLRPRAL